MEPCRRSSPSRGSWLAYQTAGPAWSDAAIICPWTIYLCYGDRDVLAEHYDSMRRFMTFLEGTQCQGLIRGHPDVVAWGGFGDWLALDGSGITEGRTPKDLIGTAFYAYAADPHGADCDRARPPG